MLRVGAAHLGHAEVVRTLIKAGAPLDHVNDLGTPLALARARRYADMVKALEAAGAK